MMSILTFASGVGMAPGKGSTRSCVNAIASPRGVILSRPRGRHRQPIRQDHGSWRPARLRWRQKGHRRQALVDTQGNLLKVKLHPADIHDKQSSMLLLTCLHLLFPRITLVWADTHYQGIKTWARENLGLKSSSTGGPVSVLSAGQEPPSRP